MPQPNLDRATRYNTMSLPPPGLKQIVAVLRRQARKFGGTLPTDGNTIRGLFTKADKEYEQRGRADDTFRFLRNHGILVEDVSLNRFYIDPDQAEKVLDACERHSAAPDVPDQHERLEALKSATPSKEASASTGTRAGSGEYDLRRTTDEETPVDAADNATPAETEPPANLSDEGSVAEMRTFNLLPHTATLALTTAELRVYVETLERHLSDSKNLLSKREKLDQLREKKLRLERELAETDQVIDELMTLD